MSISSGGQHLGIIRSTRLSLKLFTRRDRRILGLISVLQVLLSLLDLVAVFMIGVVALIAGTVATGNPPAMISALVDRLDLSDVDPLVLAVVVAAIAGILMVMKSVLTFLLTRRAFKFLANRQAMISSRLAESLLRRPLLQVQRRTSQETAYALTTGVNAITLRIVGQAVVLIGESSLIIMLGVVMLVVDPLVAVFAIGFFGLVAFLLHKILAATGSRLGLRAQETDTLSLSSIQEILRSYREVAVSGRTVLHIEDFKELRWAAASVQGTLMIVSQISKYIFELALIVGGAVLALSQLVTRDIAAAVAIIAVFLAAASRIMPSLLRLQDAAFTIRHASGIAGSTVSLVTELEESAEDGEDQQRIPQEVLRSVLSGIAENHVGFLPRVSMRDVIFGYSDTDRPTIDHLSLMVEPGTSLALVGSTGAGKSTVADLMLGVLTPDSGTVEVSGIGPLEAIRRWPGAVAYVPQDVAVSDADIRRNVALGLPRHAIDDELVWDALRRAHLADALMSQREGLDTMVGERGIKLSGGQLQRLGLARALYSRPQLLVLDEATSALDAETEASIAASIAELSGRTTLIIIAHRLATIRTCDQVAYLDSGVLQAVGTFEEVRETVEAFGRQAALLGL